MPTESMMLSNDLILYYSFSSCPQSFPASGSFPVSWVFTSGGQKIGASASISPSHEHSGLISLRIDWFNLLAIQGTLTSLLQHHSSKASILGHSAFFILQLSHPFPWRRKWQPTQCSSLENPMDRGAWWATVHGVSKESDKTE